MARPSADTVVAHSDSKIDEKKAVNNGKNSGGAEITENSVGDDGVYDPSKESVWTRLGLTAESFKRAPGATRGQVVHGDAKADAEKGSNDNPMLQQKMKDRHLNMIAVGGSIGTGEGITSCH